MPNTNTAVAPAQFTFNENTIRAINKDNEIWFVATDVSAVLEYRDAFNMTRILDDDEKGTHTVSTLGGDQEVTVISESGLYHAVLKSRKQVAVEFRKWVTKEVLPSIRRTGSYSATISKAQQGEIATRISEKFLDGRKRPYAWSRFNNHFRIASYKDLPASRFEEACEYITTMPMSKEEEAPQVLPAPLEGVAFKRFLAYFDRNQKLAMKEIKDDAFIISEDEIAKVINEPGSLIKTQTIIDIMNACADVMSRRYVSSR